MNRNMKKMIISAIAASCALLGATACTDYLYDGEIDLTPANKDVWVDYEFQHPCILGTAEDFARVKLHIDAADASDPIYAAWQQLCNNGYASATHEPNPQETLVRGDVKGTGVPSENYIHACHDAAAAYQLGLRWQLAGDRGCAAQGVKILNAWAAACKNITANDMNQYLLCGFQGYQFAAAAELLRDFDGWQTEDFAKFKAWMVDLWYRKNMEFLTNHGGTCNLHYWTNWDMANMCSVLAIGILTDDNEKVNYAINYFKNGVGSGCIKNMIPYEPVADPADKGALIAQNMESGRDQGHATLVVAVSAEFCQMAWNIGEDLFGYDNNKMLAMFEYEAKYNVKPRATGTYTCSDNEMPFTEYKYCIDCSCSNKNHGAIHTAVSPEQRGKERPGWELIYNHYAKVKGLAPNNFYYSELFADQLRYTNGTLTGDGGAGDSRYGGTSAAFDQVGWGTLLYYRGE